MISVPLIPAPGVEPSPFPWACDGDGTIRGADGSCVCVLGNPFDGMAERDISNGAVILAAGRARHALQLAEGFLEGFEDDPTQPEAAVALAAVRAALSSGGSDAQA